MKSHDILNLIINKIHSENERHGVMSEDEDNGRLLSILSKYELEDDEEMLEDAFGDDGLHRIRDAEAGIY